MVRPLSLHPQVLECQMLLCKMRKLFCLCLRLVYQLVSCSDHSLSTHNSLSPPTSALPLPFVHFPSFRQSLPPNKLCHRLSLSPTSTNKTLSNVLGPDDKVNLPLVIVFLMFLFSCSKCGVPAVDISLGIDRWTVNSREVDSWTLGQWGPESGNRPRFLHTDTKQSWKYPAVGQRSGT